MPRPLSDIVVLVRFRGLEQFKEDPMPRYTHWQTDVRCRAPALSLELRRGQCCCGDASKGCLHISIFARPSWGLTRIAVGMAVSKAGYLLALSNLCGTAHLPLFVGFGRVKDIRPGDLRAPFSEIAGRCSAELAVTIYRESSPIVWWARWRSVLLAPAI
jgi:hypothetical protein